MSRIIRNYLKQLKDEEYGTQIFQRGLRNPVAFVYPNLYRVGMSNLGLHIIYQIINRRDDSACERFFLPDKDMLREHRKTGTPLLSLENQRPLNDFSIIFIMWSFEMDYDNILSILELGNIRLRADKRGGKEPLLIIGGPCATFNPEPMAEIADAFVIGEGEEVVQRILDLLREEDGKKERLLKLARLDGVYVPSLYEPVYDEKQNFMQLKPLEGAPATVKRQWVKDIDAFPHKSVIVTPNTEFANMYIVEVARGCGRHCRFCMAGYCFRRPRPRDLHSIMADIADRPPQTKKVGLMGAAVSDHPMIKELTEYLIGDGVSFSVASLRADTLDKRLTQALADGGQRTMTVAPEAGSERIRRSINKGIGEEHIYNAVELAAAAGMPNIKLYYMIGLPGEVDEDIREMISMVERIREKMDSCGNKGELVISVNAFVPKPFTPYQWEPLCSVSILKKRFKMLREAFKKQKRIKLIMESLKETVQQAIIARGDRKTGEFLLAAHTGGDNLKNILRRSGISIESLTEMEITPGCPLPWQHLDMGFTEDYLAAELQRSKAYQFTPMCCEGCTRCGVCADTISMGTGEKGR